MGTGKDRTTVEGHGPLAVEMVALLLDGDSDGAMTLVRDLDGDHDAESVALMAGWLAANLAQELDRQTDKPGLGRAALQRLGVHLAQPIATDEEQS